MKIVKEIRGSLKEAAAQQEEQAKQAKLEQLAAQKVAAALSERAATGSSAGGGASTTGSEAKGAAATSATEPSLTAEQAKLRKRFTCAARGESRFTLDAEQRIISHDDSIDWTCAPRLWIITSHPPFLPASTFPHRGRAYRPIPLPSPHTPNPNPNRAGGARATSSPGSARRPGRPP